MDVPTPFESESMSKMFEPWLLQLFLVFLFSFSSFSLFFLSIYIPPQRICLEVLRVKRTFQNI